MATLTPPVRAHLWRLVRLPAFTAGAAALVAPLLRTYAERVPAIGAIVAVLEVIAAAAAGMPGPVVPGSAATPPVPAPPVAPSAPSSGPAASGP